jgi:3-phenylpropionate/cinnamic acid dioxygenase small subunit
MPADGGGGGAGADRWSDRADIIDLMSRFATGIDACDWPLYRSVFTDEIDLDYSSWRAESIGPRRADDWVARAARLFPGLTATRHALTNQLVTFDDADTAHVRVAVRADHVLAADDPDRDDIAVFTLNGHYDDVCVRTAAGWRIRGKRLVVEWCIGDRELLNRAAALVAAGTPTRIGTN